MVEDYAGEREMLEVSENHPEVQLLLREVQDVTQNQLGS
jgi:hypothetical protein